MRVRFGCLHFKTEWFTGLTVDNKYLSDRCWCRFWLVCFLMASVMVEDQVIPLAVSTTCAACASMKAGVNVRSQRLLSVIASEEEAAAFGGCYQRGGIPIIHENQADYGITTIKSNQIRIQVSLKNKILKLFSKVFPAEHQWAWI